MIVIENILRYTPAKNYKKIGLWFYEVIAKMKWCSFFDSHGSFTV